MKKTYLSPEVETLLINFEKSLLNASLAGSRGENLNGTKNTYDWDWAEDV